MTDKKYPFSCPCGRVLDHESLLNKVEAGQGVFDALVYSCPECLVIISFDRVKGASDEDSPIPTAPARTVLSAAEARRLLEQLAGAIEGARLGDFLAEVRADPKRRWGVRPVGARNLVARRLDRRWKLAVHAWARVGPRVIDGLEDYALLPKRVRPNFSEKHPSGARFTKERRNVEQIILWEKGMVFTETRVPPSVPEWRGADRERWEIILAPPARTRPPHDELYSAPLDLLEPLD